jgi:pyrroloquinoline quinone (PQQ) biosynthesis protein C
MFYDQLLSATAQERAALLALPFIRNGASGAISRADYVSFLSQAYHHVKHTLPLLMACGARLPDRLDWLRLAITEYIKEETGHEEWILNDIRACGGDAERARRAQPGMAVEIMVAYAYDTIMRVHPVGFFGMVLVLEGTSTEVATRAAESLKRSLALPDAAFTYLSSHGALDVNHIRFFQSLVNRISDAGDRTVLIHCARVFYHLYGNIFRSLDADRGRMLDVAA